MASFFYIVKIYPPPPLDNTHFNVHLHCYFKRCSGLLVRNVGNVLFNDTLNTFYLRLYGVRYMVKNHSDSERKPAAAT